MWAGKLPCESGVSDKCVEEAEMAFVLCEVSRPIGPGSCWAGPKLTFWGNVQSPRTGQLWTTKSRALKQEADSPTMLQSRHLHVTFQWCKELSTNEEPVAMQSCREVWDSSEKSLKQNMCFVCQLWPCRCPSDPQTPEHAYWS